MRLVFLLLLLLLPLPLSVHAEDLCELSANPTQISGSFGLFGLSGFSGFFGSSISQPNERENQSTCSRFAQPDRPNSQATRDRPVSALHSRYTLLISPARYLAGECPSGCMIPMANTSGSESS